MGKQTQIILTYLLTITVNWCHSAKVCVQGWLWVRLLETGETIVCCFLFYILTFAVNICKRKLFVHGEVNLNLTLTYLLSCRSFSAVVQWRNFYRHTRLTLWSLSRGGLYKLDTLLKKISRSCFYLYFIFC